MFARVHDGHCAAGWIKTTCVPSLGACAQSCNEIKECGYFAYTTDFGDMGTNCAFYNVDGACPDDDEFPEYNAYQLFRERSECMSLCMYGMV